MSDSAPSLPYHEPSAPTLLLLTAFLLSLNVINHILDRTIYCGLIGQILLGIAFGTPGGKLLGEEVERVVSDLGYVGLVLVVYDGGLQTSLPTLLPNLLLSTSVAFTGIALPIGLSYTLSALSNATALQSFAAGAALCSTSLGTTFTVLGASGLVKTRMGVVLSTAAMLDDVVGLVMVQVITNLGGSGNSGGGGDFSAVTVIRPVFVSIGFVVGVIGVAWVVVRPVTGWVDAWRGKRLKMIESDGKSMDGDLVERVTRSDGFALTIHTALLVGMVAGSSYAGTSNLFAAYLAGALVSWWDGQLEHPHAGKKDTLLHTDGPGDGDGSIESRGRNGSGNAVSTTRTREDRNSITQHRTQTQTQEQPTQQSTAPHGNRRNDDHEQHSDDQQGQEINDSTGTHIFEEYYQPALQRILKPFFFASIGFSIPITRIFTGSILWRGIVYSVLMFLGKVACGLWLIRLRVPITLPNIPLVGRIVSAIASWRRKQKRSGPAGGGEGIVRDKTRGENGTRTEKAEDEAVRIQEDTHRESCGRGLNVSKEQQTSHEEWTNAIRSESVDDMVIVHQIPHNQHQQNMDQTQDMTTSRLQRATSNKQQPNNTRNPLNVHRSNESRKVIHPADASKLTADRGNADANSKSDNDGDQPSLLSQTLPARKPISLYPSLIVGGAMAARGEIGFLISSLAQSNGIFDQASSTSDTNGSTTDAESPPIFLIVTWAIMLCTIVGPIIVGVLVRRVKKLEQKAQRAEGGKEKDVLGAWGVT